MFGLGDRVMPSSFLPEDVAFNIALLLIIVSFFTSALTAAFGLGGGIAMLGALAGTAPPSVLIAVHGVVQLGSNTGRAFIQRQHVLWPATIRFSIGSLIGVGLCAALFTVLPPRLLLGLIGGFIVAMVWLPKPNIPGLGQSGLLIGGAISSFLTMFVGATGPFVQALLLPQKPTRHQLVATHAMCMTIQYALKVLAFGFAGVAFFDWLYLIVLMLISGFVGTMLGTRFLEKMPDQLFRTVLKWTLTIVALDLLSRAAGVEMI